MTIKLTDKDINNILTATNLDLDMSKYNYTDYKTNDRSKDYIFDTAHDNVVHYITEYKDFDVINDEFDIAGTANLIYTGIVGVDYF